MQWIVGVDEVGRGPLAGPVYAAAVVLDPERPIEGLADSKKLSEKKRLLLSEQIQQQAKAFAIAQAQVDEIDQLNILQASLLAMQRAVSALSMTPDLALIDGNHAPVLSIPTRTIIGGDNSEPSICAASIIAKVARDSEMQRLEQLYPGYGFAKHKGYGTKQHMQALSELGPCAIHRISFAPVRRAKSLHSVS